MANERSPLLITHLETVATSRRGATAGRCAIPKTEIAVSVLKEKVQGAQMSPGWKKINLRTIFKSANKHVSCNTTNEKVVLQQGEPEATPAYLSGIPGFDDSARPLTRMSNPMDSPDLVDASDSFQLQLFSGDTASHRSPHGFPSRSGDATSALVVPDVNSDLLHVRTVRPGWEKRVHGGG